MESITAIVGEKCANWCVCPINLVYCSPNKRLAPSIKLKHLRNNSRGRGGQVRKRRPGNTSTVKPAGDGESSQTQTTAQEDV